VLIQEALFLKRIYRLSQLKIPVIQPFLSILRVNSCHHWFHRNIYRLQINTEKESAFFTENLRLNYNEPLNI